MNAGHAESGVARSIMRPANFRSRSEPAGPPRPPKRGAGNRQLLAARATHRKHLGSGGSHVDVGHEHGSLAAHRRGRRRTKAATHARRDTSARRLRLPIRRGLVSHRSREVGKSWTRARDRRPHRSCRCAHPFKIPAQSHLFQLTEPAHCAFVTNVCPIEQPLPPDLPDKKPS